jgi:flagellar hook assembly protein FlgD
MPATATFTPTASQDLSIATTITFVNPPVNIDASFADGPGLYKLEIVDAQGLHINTLYNKPSGFEKEIWITWDGTNDQGQLARYGNYYALFTKDGVLIQKIALIWIQPGKTGNPGD